MSSVYYLLKWYNRSVLHTSLYLFTY